MRHLQICEAVVEIIQALLFSHTPYGTELGTFTIGVDIKSKKKLSENQEEGRQVFYVRVSSSLELDVEGVFKDQQCVRLVEVLLYAQAEGKDGHLSAQRRKTEDDGAFVQEVFWVNQENNDCVDLQCQHSSPVDTVDLTVKLPFIIHFRVVQQDSHMISEGQLIHKYLHKLKILNESVETTFSMKVCGVACQTNFSANRYLKVKELTVVEDLAFHLGKESQKSLYCEYAKVYQGQEVSVSVDSGCGHRSSSLSVTSPIVFYPITERYPQPSRRGIKGTILVNFYGPQLVPLLMRSDLLRDIDIDQLTNWKEVTLQPTEAAISTGIHSDLRSVVDLSNLSYLPSYASEATSFLLYISVIISSSEAERNTTMDKEITKLIQDNPHAFRQLLPAVNDTVLSSLKLIFTHRMTDYEKKHENRYRQSITMITDALCDVYNRSTNVVFRNDMNCLLKARQRQDIKKVLMTNLMEISGIQMCSGGDLEREVNADTINELECTHDMMREMQELDEFDEEIGAMSQEPPRPGEAPEMMLHGTSTSTSREFSPSESQEARLSIPQELHHSEFQNVYYDTRSGSHGPSDNDRVLSLEQHFPESLEIYPMPREPHIVPEVVQDFHDTSHVRYNEPSLHLPLQQNAEDIMFDYVDGSSQHLLGHDVVYDYHEESLTSGVASDPTTEMLQELEDFGDDISYVESVGQPYGGPEDLVENEVISSIGNPSLVDAPSPLHQQSLDVWLEEVMLDVADWL